MYYHLHLELIADRLNSNSKASWDCKSPFIL